MIDAQEWDIWLEEVPARRDEGRFPGELVLLWVVQEESVLPRQKRIFLKMMRMSGQEKQWKRWGPKGICWGNDKSLIQLLVGRVWGRAPEELLLVSTVSLDLVWELFTSLNAEWRDRVCILQRSRNEWRMGCKSSPQKHRVHYCQCQWHRWEMTKALLTPLVLTMDLAKG